METILIVEDSPLFAKILAKRLYNDPRFMVFTAASMSEAKNLAETYSFTFAILDLTLPDAIDCEIVDYITSRNIPCIVFTGAFDAALREQILSKNVFDYVLKDSHDAIDNVVRSLDRYFINRQSAILVVDDSATSRKQICKMLKVGSFSLLEASNGVEALRVLEKNPAIKLVITDYNMPEMDGFELVSQIRKTHSRETLAVIGVSSESGDPMSAKFLKKGANDFLSKPFFHEELHNKVLLNLELIERYNEIRQQAERLATLEQQSTQGELMSQSACSEEPDSY